MVSYNFLGIVLIYTCLSTFLGHVYAQAPYNETQAASNTTKRGIVYIGTSHPLDYQLFTSREAPITWYYAFTTYPSLRNSDLAFTSMIHGADSAASDVNDIQQLAQSGGITHVLVYNEPDGSLESGGSDITPYVAARTYLDTIAPLRQPPWNLKLSLPATTGSPNGLNWLRSFNDSCLNLTSTGDGNGKGCEFDFLAAHWYGDFPAMASWLGTLHAYYPHLPIWLTEFALPQFPENVTYEFLNQSLAFLDQTEWVERYSYFGTFRESAANSFTGSNVAMLDNDGGLTQVGNLYLGGEARGYHVGERGTAKAAGAPSMFAMLALIPIAVISSVRIMD